MLNHFFSGVNAVFILISLTPVLIMLTMCVVYFLFDAIHYLQRRRRLM